MRFSLILYFLLSLVPFVSRGQPLPFCDFLEKVVEEVPYGFEGVRTDDPIREAGVLSGKGYRLQNLPEGAVSGYYFNGLRSHEGQMESAEIIEVVMGVYREEEPALDTYHELREQIELGCASRNMQLASMSSKIYTKGRSFYLVRYDGMEQKYQEDFDIQLYIFEKLRWDDNYKSWTEYQVRLEFTFFGVPQMRQPAEHPELEVKVDHYRSELESQGWEVTDVWSLEGGKSTFRFSVEGDAGDALQLVTILPRTSSHPIHWEEKGGEGDWKPIEGMDFGEEDDFRVEYTPFNLWNEGPCQLRLRTEESLPKGGRVIVARL